MEFLFGNYDKQVRPSYNKSSAVNMSFGIAYVQLIQLDEREQILISNVWIRQKWHNHLLTWNPADFNNITEINVDPKKVWLPDIVLYNNAKGGPGAGTMYQFKTKVKLRHDGLNTWYAPSIIRSGCNIDITYFPFDDQFCELHFGSWTYSGLELDIFRDRETADLTSYLASAEIDLKSAKSERTRIFYSCCPDTPYPNIIFTIHLRRQPGFFLFNVIIPSMVITCIAILTFASPPATGERIGLSIVSFLSLSFLCMMVADGIPVNSDVSPLITQFLIICMILIASALAFNILSMNLQSSKPVPPWFKTIMFRIVGPCIGFCVNADLGKSKLRRNIIQEPEQHYVTLTEKIQDAILSKFGFIEKELNFEKNQRLTIKNSICPSGTTPHEYQVVIDNMNDILDRSTHEINEDLNKDFWRCIAQTVDRMFMIIFSTCFVFVSAVMLLKGYGHQIKVQAG